MTKLKENKRSQTILVTGCAGFIGSNLCEYLIKLGHNIIGLDNFDAFYDRRIKENNLENFISHNRFKFYEIDLRVANALNKLEEPIDLVVHLAGKAGVRPSVSNPQAYIESNITSTKNVLDYMRRHGIKKMAFASSSSVYGNCSRVPFNETQHVDKLISPYAFTKRSCELLNYTYHHLYDIDIVNMRLFTAFGPRQRPDLAIHKFLRLMHDNKVITIYGDGTTARDYTYIDDIVRGISLSCDYLMGSTKQFETINLGSGKPIKITELLDALSKATGLVPRLKYEQMPAGDVNQTYAHTQRAKKLIGFQSLTSFEDGISTFVDWYQDEYSETLIHSES